MREYRRGVHTGEQLATFQLGELIGLGGAAEVYLGTDLTLGREVAVKVLLGELSLDREFVRRFREEARRVAALEHAHIVPVYYFGEERGHLFLVMPLLRGGSLRQRLQREKRLPSEEAVRIAIEVASGLEAAHRAYLIHRDVKPENILFNNQGEALLTDFGLARDLPGDAAVWEQHNTTGIFGIPVGTPEYMAPEQFQRDVSLDQRVDVYALGVVVYEMLTGRTPFSGSPRELAARATSRLCPPPSAVVASVWPALDPRVMTALAAMPDARYRGAAEFATALRQTLGMHGVVPQDVSVIETRQTSIVPGAALGTAELPAFFRLPTPPELLAPEPWPVQVGGHPNRVARASRLALLLALVLLLVTASTGAIVLFARSLDAPASLTTPGGSPTARPPTPRPSVSPGKSPTATSPILPPLAVSPSPGTTPSPTATPTATATPTPTPSPTPVVGTGLLGDYYNNIPNSIPLPFPCGTPAYSRIDPQINFGISPNYLPPADLPPPPNGDYYFGVCWIGHIQPSYSEQYTFTIYVSGAAELVMNGSVIARTSHFGSSQSIYGTINLTAGQLAATTLYYIGYYAASEQQYNVVRLYWKSNSQTDELVPQTALYPQ